MSEHINGSLGKEPSLQELSEGKGFELIQRYGFETYRAALSQIPYSVIVEKQLEQPSTVKLEAATGPAWAQDEARYRRNLKAKERSLAMAQRLVDALGRDSKAEFRAQLEEGKKLWISGLEVPREQHLQRDQVLKRIYFSVDTSKAPEAFESLLKSLVKEKVMGKVDLAFNFESYHAESLSKSFENNTLILYVLDQDPEVMNRISAAVSTSKQVNPTAWQLSQSDIRESKRRTIQDFMIPLDETTAFVEMEGAKSYHSSVRNQMAVELSGQVHIPAENIVETLATWTPETPASFERFPNRRKYMPGLVFRS